MHASHRYTHVVFDADDTLLCYRADEREAFSRLFLSLEIPISEELLSFSNDVSEEIWTTTGLYDVHSPRIQREYHDLYRAHIEHVFDAIFAFCKEQYKGVRLHTTPARARDLFLQELARGGHYVNGAIDTLSALKERGYILSVATNGLTSVQRGRIAPLSHFFTHIFISESLGAIKPSASFFEQMLALSHTEKEQCLFVGDSLLSDVAGAKHAGIDCCFFNPNKKEVPENLPAPDYTIEKLTDLLAFL